MATRRETRSSDGIKYPYNCPLPCDKTDIHATSGEVSQEEKQGDQKAEIDVISCSTNRDMSDLKEEINSHKSADEFSNGVTLPNI